MKDFKKWIYLSVGVVCLAVTASAGPIGTASITNCASGGVTVSATTVTWLPAVTGTTGCITTGNPTSISYSGGTFTSGNGTIENLPPGSLGTFIVLAGGGLDFSLASFGAVSPTDGVCSTTVALASGHSCITFVGSPFLLISQGAATVVSLTTLGIVTDTGDSSTAVYQGVFSTQLGQNTAAIASAIDGGGSVTNTYSATLLVGTPEPGTLSLFLLGGGALLGIGRKRFGKR